MKKEGKIAIIAIIIIILGIFLCEESFAAKLGEKNDGGIVVAIYKNKEYTAIGVTVKALQNGDVLPWSKWSSGDLITIKNRCDNENFGRYWDNEKGEFIDYGWYREFLQEFMGRKDIETTGEDNSTMTGDDNQHEQVDENYKTTEDMNEEDKKAAEEYKKKNEEREKLKKYTATKIITYLKDNNYKVPDGCDEKWEATLLDAIKKVGKDSPKGKEYIKVYEKAFRKTYETADGDIAIYNNPNIDRSKTSQDSLDDMISDANSFINKGKVQYQESALKNFSTILYNCLLGVGVALALVIGIIIGIKYMMGSVEEKANYKQMLVPYLVGCFVVFGAFGIWKIVVIILESI